jgi:hypothetical protein
MNFELTNLGKKTYNLRKKYKQNKKTKKQIQYKRNIVCNNWVQMTRRYSKVWMMGAVWTNAAVKLYRVKLL